MSSFAKSLANDILAPDWNNLSRDDLGYYFVIDPSTGQIKPNPLLWAYRIMYLDDDNYYHSPQQEKQPPIKMGDISSDTGLGEKDSYREGEEDEQASIYDGLSPDEIASRYKHDANTDSGYNTHEDMLSDFFDSVLGYSDDNQKSRIINPSAETSGGKVFLTDAPHRGLSVIGFPHELYAILGPNDFMFDALSGMDRPEGRKVYDALRRKLYRKDGKVLEGRDNSPLSAAFVKDFKKSYLYNNVLDDSDRKLLEGAETWNDLTRAFNLMDLPAKVRKEILTRPLEQRETDVIGAGKYDKVNGAIVNDGDEFFRSADEKVRNLMYDKVVEALMRTMRRFTNGEKFTQASSADPKKIRLVQVFTPVQDLYTVNDVLAGKTTGQRDYMNEFLTNSFELFNDIGGADTLMGPNGPFRYYWLLRMAGYPSNQAWNEALGKRFGDIRYLISDEDKKIVHDEMRRDFEPLLKQSMITSGITRGMC